MQQMQHQPRKLAITSRKMASPVAQPHRYDLQGRQGAANRAQAAAEPAGTGGQRKLIVSVGEALFDLIADQKGLKREHVKSWTPYAGGAPANVATALGKLGVDTLFVGALGRDAEGDRLYDIIKKSNVRLDGIQRRDEPTRDVYVTRDDKGDREFAGFGRPTETYADAHLDKSAIPLDDIKDAALVLTGTLGLAYPGSRDSMRAVVEAAKQGGATVMVDVNWRPVFWKDADAAQKEVMEYLQQADLIKVSDADLEWLIGMPLATALINPCAVLDAFPKAKGVMVTAGGEGAAYCVRESDGTQHSGFVPVFKVNVIDTTGAGDAFTAGFIWRLLQAGSFDALASDPKALKEAMVFACATGALTCTAPGAIEAQPSLQQVEQLFDTSKSWYNFW